MNLIWLFYFAISLTPCPLFVLTASRKTIYFNIKFSKHNGLNLVNVNPLLNKRLFVWC